MRPVIFLGPSLPRDVAAAVLDAELLPPVAQGDVLRAVLRRPPAIGIIDGYFERVPAVWHKEILHALSEGIPVYGAASMGALRAAELGPFGMIGVGAIHEAFASGELTDDDEVAVAHGDAASGYRVASDAMVDIRATCAAAVGAGVVDADTAAALVAEAKARFYPDRSLPLIVREAVACGAIGAGQGEALRAWLPRGRVHRKREDAYALLTRIRDDLAAPAAPPALPDFPFAETQSWRALAHLVTGAIAAGGDDASGMEAILDEARLADPEQFARLEERALLRVLAAESARREGAAPDGEAMHAAILAFRREHALVEPADVEAWLADGDAVKHDLIRLAEQDCHLAWVLEETRAVRRAGVIDELRRTGEYAALARRAGHKRAVLEAAGSWRVIAAVPDADSAAPELAAAFDSVGAMRRALARERAFTAAAART